MLIYSSFVKLKSVLKQNIKIFWYYTFSNQILPKKRTLIQKNQYEYCVM